MPKQDTSMLPPGTEYVDDQLIRRITHTASDGSEWIETRLVAGSMKEARDKVWDYYDPVLGWIRYGFKLERDREVEHILADNSETLSKRPEN